MRHGTLSHPAHHLPTRHGVPVTHKLRRNVPIFQHFNKNGYTITLVNDAAAVHGELPIAVRQLFPLCPRAPQ